MRQAVPCGPAKMNYYVSSAWHRQAEKTPVGGASFDHAGWYFDGWKLRLQQRISGMHIIHSEMLFLRRR